MKISKLFAISLQSKIRITFLLVALTYNFVIGFYLKDFLVLSQTLMVFYLLSVLPSLFLVVEIKSKGKNDIINRKYILKGYGTMLIFYISLIDSDESNDKFESLYLKYKKHMKHIAMKILGDEHLAEDAVHNAFIKIISNLHKFNEIDCQETRNLIVIIIRSVSIDMYRKRNREFENTDILDKELSVETDFSIIEVDNILKEIDVLPEIYKDILLLKVEYGYKDREIAKLLGIKVDTVSKRLERARKQLCKQLNEGGSVK